MLTGLETWQGRLLPHQHDRSEQEELRYAEDDGVGTRGHGDRARRRRTPTATALEGIGADPPSLSNDDENVMMTSDHIPSDDDDDDAMYVRTRDMIADILTKPLGREDFARHAAKLVCKVQR